jgi:hypothetical protein
LSAFGSTSAHTELRQFQLPSQSSILIAMSLLALSKPDWSVAIETLGGSSGFRADIEPLTDHPTTGGRLFLSVDLRLTTSYEAVNPTAGHLSMSQRAMMPHTAMIVGDQMHLETASGCVLGGTGHNITYDHRTIYAPVQPPSGKSLAD